MILNIKLIYVSPGCYTIVQILLMLLPKIPLINLSKICGVHLKKKVGKISPTNKNELIKFIREDWKKIPSEYDIPKLIQSMRRRLQRVIDAQNAHTKY